MERASALIALPRRKEGHVMNDKVLESVDQILQIEVLQ